MREEVANMREQVANMAWNRFAPLIKKYGNFEGGVIQEILAFRRAKLRSTKVQLTMTVFDAR